MRRLYAFAALLAALANGPQALADGSGPMEPFPITGAYSAFFREDREQITIIDFAGNYDKELAGGSPNVEPRAVIAREFLRTHPDQYDFLVAFSTFEVDTGEVLAFHWLVQNQVQDIGLPQFNNSALFGGRLTVEAADGASSSRTIAGSTQRSSSQMASRRSTPAEAQAPPRNVAPEPDVVSSEIEAQRSLGARNRSAAEMHERISGNVYTGSKTRDAAGRLRNESGEYVEDGAARAAQAIARARIGQLHGNSLESAGPHDVYVIRDAQSGRIYHFGETGRGYKTRGAEWVRKLRAEYGLETLVEHLRTVQGKAAARALETRYIETYEKINGIKPGYIDEAGNLVPTQKARH